MLNQSEFQSMLVNLNQPNAIEMGFIAYLAKEKAPYDQAKSVATFVSDSKKVITALSSQTFYNTQYPASEHFLIFGVRVLSGTGANVDTTIYTPGVADANAQNGLLTITNNGSIEIKDLPLTAFNLSTGNADNNAGGFTLVKPIFWQGQTTLSVVVNQANPTATANYNLDIQFIGIKLI